MNFFMKFYSPKVAHISNISKLVSQFPDSSPNVSEKYSTLPMQE